MDLSFFIAMDLLLSIVMAIVMFLLWWKICDLEEKERKSDTGWIEPAPVKTDYPRPVKSVTHKHRIILKTERDLVRKEIEKRK
jgi:hypothetical protein